MSLLMPSSAAKEQLLAAAGRRGAQRSGINGAFRSLLILKLPQQITLNSSQHFIGG
jgi:hypothetical protein